MGVILTTYYVGDPPKRPTTLKRIFGFLVISNHFQLISKDLVKIIRLIANGTIYKWLTVRGSSGFAMICQQLRRNGLFGGCWPGRAAPGQ